MNGDTQILDPEPAGMILPPAEGTTPAEEPTAGSTFVSPGYQPPILSQREQEALQYRLAAATQAPRRTVALPGMDVPDMGAAYRAAYSQLPVAQASKAIEAAVKYQGMRGYQNELSSGTPPAQALAKWAPMLFHSSPAAMASVLRGTQTPSGPITAAPILDPTGRAIPGHYAFRSATGIHPITTGMNPYQRASLAMRAQEMKQRAAREQDALKKRDKLQALRAEQKMLADDPMVKMEISAKATPTWRKEAERKKARYASIQEKIDAMIEGTDVAPAAPAASKPAAGTSSRVRVKSPAGKSGTIPIDQLDDALAAGFTEIK